MDWEINILFMKARDKKNTRTFLLFRSRVLSHNRKSLYTCFSIYNLLFYKSTISATKNVKTKESGNRFIKARGECFVQVNFLPKRERKNRFSIMIMSETIF